MKDAVFLKQMRILNKHLASSKKVLSSLLKDDEPSVTLKDGSVHYFDKKELEKIAEIIPRNMHKTLRLPIFIELSSSSMERVQPEFSEEQSAFLFPHSSVKRHRGTRCSYTDQS